MGKVAIVGNGNVGHHFAARISQKHDVSLFSKTQTDGVQTLEEFDPGEFEFAFLCLPDDVIQVVSEEIQTSDCTILHTSGSRPITDLSKHDNRGVVYPLQTFTKDKEIDFTSFPIFIEGTQNSEKPIFDFVRSFSTDVRLMNSQSRAKLHLAAVFACNFSNHMYHIADSILSSIGMPFKDMQHLANETVDKAAELSPLKSQTGPAARDDLETISKQLDMITNEDWRKIYELISNDIRKSL